MREFKKQSKTNLLLIGISIIMYITIIAVNAQAQALEESPTASIEIAGETMPSPVHGFPELHTANDTLTPFGAPPEWIARMVIHELRINQILYRDEITRSLLQKDQFQHFTPVYEEKLEFLNLALTQRHLIAESDITNLVESTISLQEFLLLASQSTTNASTGYNYWSLALAGMQTALLFAIIFALGWGKSSV